MRVYGKYEGNFCDWPRRTFHVHELCKKQKTEGEITRMQLYRCGVRNICLNILHFFVYNCRTYELLQSTYRNWHHRDEKSFTNTVIAGANFFRIFYCFHSIFHSGRGILWDYFSESTFFFGLSFSFRKILDIDQVSSGFLGNPHFRKLGGKKMKHFDRKFIRKDHDSKKWISKPRKYVLGCAWIELVILTLNFSYPVASFWICITKGTWGAFENRVFFER